MVFATYLPHLLVRFAPLLKSSHNYNLSIMSDSTSPEARLDFKAGSIFDVRVTQVNSKCNQGKQHPQRGGEKAELPTEGVPDVEMGSFTHLVFETNSGMGADCNCFLKRLAEKLSEKNEEPYHITITWIKALLFLRF